MMGSEVKERERTHNKGIEYKKRSRRKGISPTDGEGILFSS